MHYHYAARGVGRKKTEPTLPSRGGAKWEPIGNWEARKRGMCIKKVMKRDELKSLAGGKRQRHILTGGEKRLQQGIGSFRRGHARAFLCSLPSSFTFG